MNSKKTARAPKSKLKIPSSRLNAELLAGRKNEVETWRIFKIMSEFVSGFETLRRYDKAATIFGSARNGLKEDMYKEAEELGRLLAKEGFAVITGGGPGIMEAANKGAKETGGDSIGMNIKLPREQKINSYLTDHEEFSHFFTRKVMLAFSSQVYIFFPGGFGTLDEFFEMITLIQTKKINPIPIVLIGRDFWEPLLSFIDKTVCEANGAINDSDKQIYNLVADSKEAIRFIKTKVKVE